MEHVTVVATTNSRHGFFIVFSQARHGASTTTIHLHTEDRLSGKMAHRNAMETVATSLPGSQDMGKRYTAPTGIHGFRRRVARKLMKWTTAPVPPSREPLPTFGVHRILVCRTSHSVGNTLLLTPLLAELEVLYPGAEIDIVTQSPAGTEIYGAYGTVRQVFLLPSRFPPHLPWVMRVIRQVRATTYDLAIDPDPRSKTGRLMLRTCRARLKLGYHSHEKAGAITHGCELPPHVRHVAHVPVYLLRHAMHRREGMDYPRADLRLRDVELAASRARLDAVLALRSGWRGKPVIGVFANATGKKRLGKRWWFDMLDRLEALMPGHAFVEFTPAGGGSLLDHRYPTLYCGSLRRMAACMAHVDAFISVDSGPMHVAWAAGATTFGIFTGTDTRMWGPFGPTAHVLEHARHTPRSLAETVARLRGNAQLVA
jgi:heptosyltransferase III